MAYICDNSGNQSHKTVNNASYTFVASSAFVHTKRSKMKNPAGARFFIFACWDYCPKPQERRFHLRTAPRKEAFLLLLNLSKSLTFRQFVGKV